MSLFSVLRIAVVAVVLSFVLSGCFGTRLSEAEYRAQTCPTCNDAQWNATKAEIQKKAFAKFMAKKECSDRCGANPEVRACYASAKELKASKADPSIVLNKEFECTITEITCSNACSGNFDRTALNMAKAETAEQIANSILQSMPANEPVKEQPTLQVSGHHPGVGTIPNRQPQISDTPLWTCLNKNNWRTRTFGDGKSALSCISAKNSKGSTFTVSADFRAFNPPNKDNFDWSNPTSYLKLFTAGCNVRAGKVVATSAPNPAVVALNLGAKACRELRDSMQSKGPGYLGEYEIYLDGELVQSCPTVKPKGYAKIMDHVYCFQLMLANKDNRSKLATYTGIRAYNKFGSPDAVHILHSCANKSNWASYGRDATSEEVGVCKTRDTIQTGAPYWVEARQLNLGDGKETIKITIGMSRSKSLNRTENTRIQDIALTYHCGNKSFDRMRKEPRETSAACINDMLGLVNANLGSLNREQKSNAKQITALGGYGRTNAEEIHILTCRDTRLGPGCKG
ncbi:hypothetical protein GCM10007879_20390 [Maritalea porphyrae]|uniref:Uncharacterized protein n=2 Tax=Maritalea porphyrae TaxID=880732 RepID=A0ABQ5UR97_9HYPH|nr:hypothetical protein GCM10007879_20390 [Maritalea porphyrae]